ncbi:hypothetical protein CTI12_AA154580 [Artemisia annua]|uniref:Zinc knuckle CX2CX4HX4C n=1 Tax=Artemisia annua TaxID=35608 RepID=A0A2U1PH54_ARTAN|nr:hypothetical protein CTI12_AA154580 [Artemisia annua]
MSKDSIEIGESSCSSKTRKTGNEEVSLNQGGDSVLGMNKEEEDEDKCVSNDDLGTGNKEDCDIGKNSETKSTEAGNLSETRTVSGTPTKSDYAQRNVDNGDVTKVSYAAKLNNNTKKSYANVTTKNAVKYDNKLNHIPTEIDDAGVGRGGYARVLVEVQAQKELPAKIDVLYKNNLNEIIGSKIVQVAYSWKPPCCKECGVVGHNDVTCPKNNNINKDAKVIEQVVESDGFTEVGDKEDNRQKSKNNGSNKSNADKGKKNEDEMNEKQRKVGKDSFNNQSFGSKSKQESPSQKLNGIIRPMNLKRVTRGMRLEVMTLKMSYLTRLAQDDRNEHGEE